MGLVCEFHDAGSFDSILVVPFVVLLFLVAVVRKATACPSYSFTNSTDVLVSIVMSGGSLPGSSLDASLTRDVKTPLLLSSMADAPCDPKHKPLGSLQIAPMIPSDPSPNDCTNPLRGLLSGESVFVVLLSLSVGGGEMLMVALAQNDKFKITRNKFLTLFSHTIYIQVSTVQCSVVEVGRTSGKQRDETNEHHRRRRAAAGVRTDGRTLHCRLA